MGRKGISIDEDLHDRGTQLKRDGESWNELLKRAFAALDEGRDDTGAVATNRTVPDDVLTEEHIADIAREAADEVEGRLSRR